MEGLGDGTEGLGFGMPMLMNQQPHLFGAYGQDGSPVQSVLPAFQDEPSMSTGEDQNDAKRRRIARVRILFLLSR